MLARPFSAWVMVIICTTSFVRADVIVPNAFSATEAPAAFSLTTAGSSGRTYQLTIKDTQLTGLVGQNLQGLQWRLNNVDTAAAWPSATTTMSSFEIRVGPGVDPATVSSTFASNFSATPTLVRSGGISFGIGAFTNTQPTGTTPEAFGPAVTFGTPYLYTGGHLTIEYRFSQQVGVSTQLPLDGVAATDTGNGWGTNFSARFGTGSTATTGGNANFIVTNLIVPEPSFMAVFAGIAVFGVGRYRRQR